MKWSSHQTLTIVRPLAFREVRVGLPGEHALELLAGRKNHMIWEKEDGGQIFADCLGHPMIPEKPPDQGTFPQGSPDTEDIAHSQCCNCRAGQHCSDSPPEP